MNNRTLTAIALVAVLAIAAVGAGFAYSATTSNTGNQTDNEWVSVGIYSEAAGATWDSSPMISSGTGAELTAKKVYWNTVKNEKENTTWIVADSDGTVATESNPYSLLHDNTTPGTADDIYLRLAQDTPADDRLYAVVISGLSDLFSQPNGISVVAKLGTIEGTLNSTAGTITFTGVDSEMDYKIALGIFGSYTGTTAPVDLSGTIITFTAYPDNTDVEAAIATGGAQESKITVAEASAPTTAVDKAKAGTSMRVTAAADSGFIKISVTSKDPQNGSDIVIAEKIVYNGGTVDFKMPQNKVTVKAETVTSYDLTKDGAKASNIAISGIDSSGAKAVAGELLTITNNDSGAVKVTVTRTTGGVQYMENLSIAASGTWSFVMIGEGLTITAVAA